jgi:hypothetical protein
MFYEIKVVVSNIGVRQTKKGAMGNGCFKIMWFLKQFLYYLFGTFNTDQLPLPFSSSESRSVTKLLST